jgi:hypothetical protein
LDNCLQLTVVSMKGRRPLEFDAVRAWNGGWAGRNQDAVREHIAEMAALGVAAPAVTPIWFPLSNNLVTTSDRIQVLGNESSGEVEYALLFAGDTIFVTVASDHSDRGIEKYSVQASKQLYPNVIVAEVWPFAECHEHWDELILRCWVTVRGDRHLYQEAKLSTLISADTWIEVLRREGLAREGLVFLSGTPATIGGLVYGDGYEIQLQDPVLKRSISHSYAVEALGTGHQ